jgi:hypothetical protein
VDINGNAATERVDCVLAFEEGGRHRAGASGFQGTGIAIVALEAASEGVGGGGGVGRRLAPVALEAPRATACVLPSALMVGARRLLPPAEAAPQQQPHAPYDCFQTKGTVRARIFKAKSS